MSLAVALWRVWHADCSRTHEGVGVDGMLVDRLAEREALCGLVASAAAGRSGALVLHGEPGAGKTTLLDETADTAAKRGMQIARLAGVAPETQFGYAGLHRLLLPFADHLRLLPDPQQDALRGTFGLIAGPPVDPFLVGLATLTLLADVASHAPLVCAIDDVQWLDAESAAVLGFAARRLRGERVVLLFAVREPADQVPALAGIPDLGIEGLRERAGLELLSSLTPGPLSPAVGARIVAETGGNPLALAEVARELSATQLAGCESLPEPLRVDGPAAEVCGSRLGLLSHDARLMLALAAAEPAIPQALSRRAACELGVDPDIGAAELAGLAEFTPDRAVFPNPLTRSAAYYGTPAAERRRIHQALAAVRDAERTDRTAWHLAMAAAEPDEAVATRLEDAASRAKEGGGYADAAMFLCRAAELSPQDAQRVRRQLSAAALAVAAGQPVRAGALLESAGPGLSDPLAQARAGWLAGTLRFVLGHPAEAAPMLLEAACALAPADPRDARKALLEAVRAALCTGWSASQPMLSRIAAAAAATPAAAGPGPIDLLLDGFAARVRGGYPASVPLFRRATAMLAADDLSSPEGLRGLGLGCVAAADLFDDQAQSALAARLVQFARRDRALAVLPMALNSQGIFAEVPAGRFDAARACFTEALEIAELTGDAGVAGTSGIGEVYELAWRGREADARKVAADAALEAAGAERGAQGSRIDCCLAVLELGLGDYQAAVQRAMDAYADDAPFFGTRVLPDLIEGAARCGETELAGAALRRLADRALLVGTPLALGLLARSRALAGDGDAGALYEQAARHLTACRSAPELARAYLVHGEWLRRQRRRREARVKLRLAHDMFTSMGAEAFADRAAVELLATGEHSLPRTAAARCELTAHEAQIARLVSNGDTNRAIAAQLFLSPSTVDYHLRKIYRKLGVASRAQLARAMANRGE